MKRSTLAAQARRDVRFVLGLACAIIGGGLAVAVAWLAWRQVGDRVLLAWDAVPIEIRLTLQASVLITGVTAAVLASVRAWREWRGRVRARERARETPPLFEFSAGSVTEAAVTQGEAMPERARDFLAQHRRKYLVRPQDALRRAQRAWAEPVVFQEPTRAGDTRLDPVLALAHTERGKHRSAMKTLLSGAGQLTSVRVLLGVGKGYTSLTRAHALKEDLARLPAKLRMNVIVTDPPSPAAAPADADEAEADAEDEPILSGVEA